MNSGDSKTLTTTEKFHIKIRLFYFEHNLNRFLSQFQKFCTTLLPGYLPMDCQGECVVCVGYILLNLSKSPDAIKQAYG